MKNILQTFGELLSETIQIAMMLIFIAIFVAALTLGVLGSITVMVSFIMWDSSINQIITDTFIYERFSVLVGVITAALVLIHSIITHKNS